MKISGRTHMGPRTRTLLRILVAVAPAVSCAAASEEGDDPVAAEVAPADEVADEAHAPAAPEDTGPAKRIFARRFVVQIRTAPAPDAFRVGYLRGGAVITATTSRPVSTEGCEPGWYELETGGFVCTGRDATAFDGERLPEARAAEANRDTDLPYQYGFARRNNVPVYRDLPTDEDAVLYEGYVIPGAEPPVPAPVATAEGATPVVPTQVVDTAASTPAGIGGVESAEAIAAGEAPVEPAEPVGPPTLESLEGERGTILLRRMMQGFYVSLDRDFRIAQRRYWRTQQHEFIPFDMLRLKTGSAFQGIPLDGETRARPLGWLLSTRIPVYELRDDGQLRRARGAVEQRHSFRIVGEHEQRGETYFAGDDGRIYRARDVTRIDPGERPPQIGDDDKWIDVDLERQSLVAYEGDRPVFATLVSSGIVISERTPDLNHATPTGLFRIRAKHLATTMDGDNAFDGPYSIQDVAYVMYYEQGYALHSAFWHDLFGRTKSHGCVNLAPRDARWLFGWTSPSLPAGWHGVYPENEDDGTWVVIHGTTPPRRR